MVAGQLVAERQAQIAVVPGGREREDQLGSSTRPFVAHLRDGEVSPTCCDGDWDQLLGRQQRSSGLKFGEDGHTHTQVDFSLTATPGFLGTFLGY